MRHMAEAGIERAIALLGEDDESVDTLGEDWANSPDDFEEFEFGDGTISLCYYREEEGVWTQQFGLEDEAAKLNLNTAERQQLTALPGIDNQLAQVLLDWRDEDSETRTSGRETEYYEGLEEDPFPARNANFATLHELLLLEGYSPSVLYGEDWNNTYTLEPYEDDGEEYEPIDDGDGELDRGILEYITLYSSDAEQAGNGTDRVDVSSASEEELMRVIPGLQQNEASAIVRHREENSFENIGDLLNVEQSEDNNSKVFSRERLKQIIDFCKVGSEDSVPGRININTAPEEVLRTLPGINRNKARAIVNARVEEEKVFNTIADLLDVGDISESDFIEVSNLITTRTYQFTARSEARIEGLPYTKTIVAVIDRSADSVNYLYWNER